MAYGNEAVQGLAQMRRAFRALPDVVREALADATEETAVHIRASAARRVPVRYGFLRDAIAMTMSRRTGQARVGVARASKSLPDGTRVDPARYAHFVEFGTEHHSDHPFMLPAAEEQKDRYLQRCRAAGQQIERDMAAIGGRNL